MPRRPGRTRSSSVSIAPVPPPTSTTVRMPSQPSAKLELRVRRAVAARARSARRTRPRARDGPRGRPRTAGRSAPRTPAGRCCTNVGSVSQACAIRPPMPSRSEERAPEQSARGRVEREAPGRRAPRRRPCSPDDGARCAAPAASQAAAAASSSIALDAGVDVLGDPQRRDDVQAPRRGQVREFPEVGHSSDSSGGGVLFATRSSSQIVATPTTARQLEGVPRGPTSVRREAASTVHAGR